MAAVVDEIKKDLDRVAMSLPCEDRKKKMPVPKVTRQLTENVLQNLASLTHVPDSVLQPSWLPPTNLLDSPPESCLVTRTGIICFKKNGIETIPATPRFFTANCVDYDYDQNATCPEWLSFLNSVFGDDQQSMEALQEWFGYLLLADTSQQKLLLIVGPPRAGKGVITEVLRMLVGSKNVTTPTLANLGEQFGLQSLLGKTLAIIPDARLSGKADTVAVVERLLSISGADPQDIQRKFLETLSGVLLPVRFVITTNVLPDLTDAAGAIVTRIIVLRLTKSFIGREDHGLKKRLAKELPGILRWAFVGWQRLQQNGRFRQPDSGLELFNDLADLSSPIKQFVDDKCELGTNCSVPFDELFKAYRNWCEVNGVRNVQSGARFGRDIKAAFTIVKTVRKNVSGKRPRWYVGIGLLKSGTRRDADQRIALLTKKIQNKQRNK